MFIFYFRYLYIVVLIAMEILVLFKKENKMVSNITLIMLACFLVLYRIFNRINRITEVALIIEQDPIVDIVYYGLLALSLILSIIISAKYKKSNHNQ